MIDIKGKCLQFLLDRDHLFEIVGMYHDPYLRDVEDIYKITLESNSTQDSFNITHSALQESDIHIEQLYEKFPRSHSPSYILDRNSHMVDFIHGPKEEPHVMVVH